MFIDLIGAKAIMHMEQYRSYSFNKLTDLCAEKCCRNSETGSTMSLGPTNSLYWVTTSSTTTTVNAIDVGVLPRRCAVYCAARMCDSVIPTINFVDWSIWTSQWNRLKSDTLAVDADRTFPATSKRLLLLLLLLLLFLTVILKEATPLSVAAP